MRKGYGTEQWIFLGAYSQLGYSKGQLTKKRLQKTIWIFITFIIS